MSATGVQTPDDYFKISSKPLPPLQADSKKADVQESRDRLERKPDLHQLPERDGCVASLNDWLHDFQEEQMTEEQGMETLLFRSSLDHM